MTNTDVFEVSGMKGPRVNQSLAQPVSKAINQEFVTNYNNSGVAAALLSTQSVVQHD